MERFDPTPAVDELDVVMSQMSGDFDAWRNQVAYNFDCTPVVTEGSIEQGATTTRRVNSMVFSEASYSAMASHRKKRHLNDTGHFVFLYRFLEGANWLHVNGTALRQSPGSLIFLDYAHEFSAVHTRAKTQGVFVPHSILGLQPGQLKGFKQIRANTTLAQLLNQELAEIFAALKLGGSTISRDRLDRLVGCLRFALGSDETELSQRAHHREALFDLILRFIEANLESRDLTTALILKRFGISRAGLYRLFESYGGVRAYISERRLIRATLDLARDAGERGHVSRAAERWGFSSDANFVRAMTSRFGATPGTLFHSQLMPANADINISAIAQVSAQLRHSPSALETV